MGSDNVMSLFDKDELDAIQMDSLAEEMSRSLDYQVARSYDALIEIYTKARRSQRFKHSFNFENEGVLFTYN